MNLALTTEQARHYKAWNPPAGKNLTLQIRVRENPNPSTDFRTWLEQECLLSLKIRGGRNPVPGGNSRMPGALPDPETMETLKKLHQEILARRPGEKRKKAP